MVPTVPAEYAQHVAGQLQRMGLPVDPWLARSGVTDRELDDPSHPLAVSRFCGLVREALALSREPALGLFVGEHLLASAHGIVGAVAVNSPTVRDALAMMERFATLRGGLFVITHEVQAADFRLYVSTTQPLGDVARPMLEALLLSLKTVLDDATMGACALSEIAFPFAEPSYGALARDMFGCRVSYGQDWAGFRGSVALLDMRLKRADPTAFEVAAHICQRELARLGAEDNLSTRVRRLLLERNSGVPSLQVTARRCHMTPRTLHRRLVEEGTSYRALLESVRHSLAVEHLKSGHFSLQEIAYRLGYTDLSNFRRAFRRWEGVPPSSYRARRRQPAKGG